MKKIEISVVIPVYNASLSLNGLVDDLFNTLQSNYKSYELILVDDKSHDNSWDVISSLCKKYSWIKGIALRKNVGQHNSILAGLNFTTGDVIITMDDDGQNSPKYIKDLYSEIQKGFDVCYAKYSTKKHNLLRKIGSYFNNIIVTLIFNKPLDLYLTSFRGFTSQIKDEIIKNKSHSIFIDGLILSITNNISKVAVIHNNRKFGKSNYTFFKLINLWLQMLTGFSVAPLRIATILGLFFSMVGFIMSIWLVYFKITSAETPLGWTSLIVAILFIGGIQLVSLGAIGEYLGRAYLAVNNYPQFSINKKINTENEVIN